MINMKYRLTAPEKIEVFREEIREGEEKFLVKPEKLAICKADIRYYFGMRSENILRERLPMALIHEACGTVISDSSGKFRTGQKVILLPNIPGKDERSLENYRRDSVFMSSRADGFMQEIVNLPAQQLVGYEGLAAETAAVTEYVSVGVHVVKSYIARRNREAEKIGIWGDGALGYVIGCLLKYFLPTVNLTVIGKHKERLDMFDFADELLTLEEVSSCCVFDAAFECVGGVASETAIRQIIGSLVPEGMINLLGVSETPIPIDTRMILEKGLLLLGRSRSTREDFEQAVRIMESDKNFLKRIGRLISDVVVISGLPDIHRAFRQSRTADFKLVMDWKL